ncbi:MAG: MBL fold metallo-hydrolase [Oscillospiraceae bacterium]|nr:MBL fold metallo-hydrolase [Oscillospiraceae bacterium]
MPMELKQIRGSTWCLMGHQLIPVFLIDEARCILLDCGTALPRLRAQIEGELARHGLTPAGVLCTHNHYDHDGTAAYFQEKYGIPVAMPLGEAECCRTEAALKSYLYVYTIGQIRSDPTLVPVLADRVIQPEEERLLFCGVTFRILHTPGHSIDHISVITPDNVCYVGDALMCGRTLETSRLPYAYDMERNLATIEALRTLGSPVMILAHCGVEQAPYDALCDRNRDAYRSALEQIKALVNRPMTMDEISRVVRREIGVAVTSGFKALAFERFIRPYLEYLVDSGSHTVVEKDGILAYAPNE